MVVEEPFGEDSIGSRSMTYKRKDAFYDRAKAAGYRSRAAYKLRELAARYSLIRRGDRVLDLGAWPGGWLQVAAELVGPQGRVVGVDLQRIEPLGLANVVLLEGDIEDATVRERLPSAARGPIDVVLSDMAPSERHPRPRRGARARSRRDGARGRRRAVRPHGRLLVKLFMSEEARAIVDQARRVFDR